MRPSRFPICLSFHLMICLCSAVFCMIFAAPSRSEPCPSAESLTRFLRLQEHLEMISYYLFFCKICTGLLFIIALIRFITMVPAIPERMQGLRKLLSHLHAAKIQTACTLCTLFSSFLLFALIGELALKQLRINALQSRELDEAEYRKR